MQNQLNDFPLIMEQQPQMQQQFTPSIKKKVQMNKKLQQSKQQQIEPILQMQTINEDVQLEQQQTIDSVINEDEQMQQVLEESMKTQAQENADVQMNVNYIEPL